jgi:hypothetical protein
MISKAQRIMAAFQQAATENKGVDYKLRGLWTPMVVLRPAISRYAVLVLTEDVHYLLENRKRTFPKALVQRAADILGVDITELIKL